MLDDKWEQRFLALAEHVAAWSKDPSTQVGAVVADNRKRVCGLGYNGFARGVEDSATRLGTREFKYKLVLHAEENALAFATRTQDCTLYTWPLPPCSHCMSLAIQHGIIRIIAPEPSKAHAERWDMDLPKQIAQEAGVELILR